jgi:class 3 adenylate cyclase
LSEIAEPEAVMEVVRQYHATLCPLVFKYEGTIERIVGDGFLVVFNDPIQCPDPSVRAVKMAVEMRAAVAKLETEWLDRGYELGFCAGIAYGFATLGRIGFENRSEYSAIGTVVNLAARLCSHANAGQILIDTSVRTAVGTFTDAEPAGQVRLKGLSRPVRAFSIRQS